VTWLWIGLAIVLGLSAVAAGLGVLVYWYLRWRYLCHVDRIFQEKPLFIIPRGQPVAGAEEVRFPTADGLHLVGCYLRSPVRRKGVILFGLEFGSNRWSSIPYCEHLLANGFDIFTFEPRCEGNSDCQPGYKPLHWVTNHEVADMQAALKYLKNRPDADPGGIGFFAISKGAGAGLLALVQDPYVRCFVTDGLYATYSTMVPYMRKWISIFSKHYFLQGLIPMWFYGLYPYPALRRIGRIRNCRFPHLEKVLPRVAPRPLLMIHGGADTYIKPEMARALYERARQPKELWMVEGAKHNQALQRAGEEYHRRVLEFFNIHLAAPVPAMFQSHHAAITGEHLNGTYSNDSSWRRPLAPPSRARDAR
jgi:pimeloyl-ACP methyl ester carboxylesterase